jgi:hypothetical protein
MKRFLAIFLLLIVSGCSSIGKKFPRDVADIAPEPTRGGLFPERNLLDADDPGALGPERYRDQGRGLASAAAQGARQSWIQGKESMGAEAMTSFQNQPQVVPLIQRKYRDGARVTKEDFIDRNSNEGSLWASDGQTNYYFTKNKVREIKKKANCF